MPSRPPVRPSVVRYTHKRSRWLPTSLREALTTLFQRVQGGALFALALALVLTLMDYRLDDPSANAISTEVVRHLFGTMGSWIADALWQFMGLPAFLLSIVLGAWGWRIGKGLGLDLVGGRLGATLVSILAAGIAVAALNPQAVLGSTRLWGGAFGKLIALEILPLLPRAFGGVILAIVMGALALATLYMACALTFGEWHSLLRKMREGFLYVTQSVFGGLRSLWNRLHRHDAYEREDDDNAEDEESAQGRDEEEEDDEEEDDEEEDAQDDEEEEEEESSFARTRPSKTIIARPKPTARQARLPLHSNDDHPLPPITLLQWPDVSRSAPPDLSEDALKKNAKLLETVLADFGVNGKITKINPGPVVTLYELEPASGTRASRVISLADDIARNMSAVSVRVASVQGRNVIGIELPNKTREIVYLREILGSEAYTDHKGALPLVLGKDIAGSPIVVDMVGMPHLLIAGTTGSGKSVAINTMILSLLYRLPPEKCRFIMIDPKMLELSKYEGIPHLLAPVVIDPKKAVVALKWTVREMEDRYRAMTKLGVRSLDGYNTRLREAAKRNETLTRTVQTGFDKETGKPIYEEQPLDLTPLPYIVVVVDEMADMMLVAGKDIEGAIQRLAQMARAAGIHILMATQRPSVDVITGTIKANFPNRVSFQVTSKIDSRTILNEQGAEQLLGQGDMLFMAGGGKVTRVHGPFVSDDEVEKVARFLREQGAPEYLNEVTEEPSDSDESGEGVGASSGDALYDKAVDAVLRGRKASISYVQRQLSIGYNRAATLIERMEEEGLISAPNHVGKREIYGRDPNED